MRIVFIGCVATSQAFLEATLAVPEAEVVGVVTRSASRFNADFAPLAPTAEAHQIPCFMADGNDQAAMAAWIRGRKPQVIYCFGWSYLLKREVLELAPLGVIGYHPAPLPKGRGRHPIIWSLALGLAETASSFFFMDEGADTGDLLSQQPVPVHADDDAASLYNRLLHVGRKQVQHFTRQLALGDYPRRPQDHAAASTWRKRGPADGEVDWRMSARSIYNLIRALARPYVGAHCVWNEQEIKLWASTCAAIDAPFAEPGRVLAADAGGIVVKCGEGAIRLTQHAFDTLPEVGTYLK